MTRGTSFTTKIPDIEKVIEKKIMAEFAMVDKTIGMKMNEIVNVVWKTARDKRAKISISEHKGRGGKRGGYRVSDPNALIGVPVNTGNLQSSIKRDIRMLGKKLVGRIYIDGPGSPYAKFVEYGTSKMAPRPFMRPALHQNLSWIKRIWEKKDIKTTKNIPTGTGSSTGGTPDTGTIR